MQQLETIYIKNLFFPEQNEKAETLTTNVWIEIVSILCNLLWAAHTKRVFTFKVAM